MNFDTLIEIMAQHGITRLAHIARELDVSPQAVSNWKARDQVPYKIVAAIQEKYGSSMDDGRGLTDDGDRTEDGKSDGDTSRKKDGGQAPLTPHPSPIQSPQPYLPYGYPEEDTISLRGIIDILMKHWKMLIIIPTITCIFAIIQVQFIAQPVYVAIAKIVPSVGGSSTSSMRGLAAQFGVSMPGGEETSVTSSWIYPEIIQSRTLARALLKRNFDTEKFGKDQPLLKILTYSEDEPMIGPDKLEKNAVNALLGMIAVFKGNSSILTLAVSASEPQFAADIATAIIEELDRHQQKFKSTRVSEKRQFIAGRIEEVQVDLEKMEEELKQFRYRNRQIQNSPSLLLEQERMIREVEVGKGIYITLKEEHELAKIQEVEETPVLHVLDPPEAPLERSKPKKRQTVILAGFLGIGLGIGLVFMREYWKNSEKV